jgi:hypothetical protein
MRGAAAPSQYHTKEPEGAPAVMRRREEEGWLTVANFVKLSVCTAAGVVFGFAAEKAKGNEIENLSSSAAERLCARGIKLLFDN